VSSELQELADSLTEEDFAQESESQEENDTQDENTEEPNSDEAEADESNSTDNEAPDEKSETDEDTNDTDDTPDEPAGMSDEDFQKELERRGLKAVDNKEQPQQPQQQQPQEPPFWDKRPKEVSEDAWDRMDAERRFIYHNLPYISVRDKDGNVHRVKTPEQLPDGFEAADDRERSRFNSEIQVQTQRAEEMRREIKRNREEYEQRQVSQKESQEIVEGIEALVKQGIVPEIKAKLGTAEFDNDAGVMRANEIINLQRQLAQQGEKVSVVTAGFLFKAIHPELYAGELSNAKAKTSSAADKERKQISRNVAGKSSRGTQSKVNNATSRPSGRYAGQGLSSQQLAEMFADEFDD